MRRLHATRVECRQGTELGSLRKRPPTDAGTTPKKSVEVYIVSTSRSRGVEPRELGDRWEKPRWDPTSRPHELNP